MNLNDLNSEVFNELNIEDKEKKKVTKQIIEITFKKIVDAVAKGENLKIKDFGTFKLKIQKSRTMIIPFTKEKKLIPEKRKIKFLLSNKLKI